jgi:hypothetical protein
MIERMDGYVKSVTAIVPATKATGAIAATVVDASGGYNRARFVVSLGAFGTAAGVSLELKKSATSNGTYAAVSGVTITNKTATSANKLVIVDVPVDGAAPFFKLSGTAGTATVGVSAICDLYRITGKLPPSESHLAQIVVV